MALDEHGYPDQKSLLQIETWDYLEEPIENLIKLIYENWWMPDWGLHISYDGMELHTGGWSGNEDVIEVLQNIDVGYGYNFFWTFHFKKMRRGGHYWFELPPRVALAAKRLIYD